MLRRALATLLYTTLVTLLPGASTAFAQTPATPPAAGQGGTSRSGGWEFSVYPILAWVPTNVSVDLNIAGGGGAGGDISGVIEDSRLDGAFLGGVGATNGAWRIDSNVMWAAFGGDRINTPRFSVDVDAIYAYGSVGRRLAKDIYVTGGVRRLALNYEITVAGSSAPISRKPGVWDPLVGVGYHRLGTKLDLHAAFEGGGFGVGSDSEYAASFRADWKPWKHVGITAGYGVLVFTISDEKLGQLIVAKQNLNGPVIGLGLYF